MAVPRLLAHVVIDYPAVVGIFDRMLGRKDAPTDTAELPPRPRLPARSSVLSGPGGDSGLFERRWDPESRTLEMTYAFREDLPSWIEAGRPLIPGKGVPTTMYVTMRMMKQFGMDFGGARLCRMIAIHEIRSVAQLASARRRDPDRSVHDLVQQTHSFKYASSVLRMTGHVIAAVRLEPARAEQGPIGELCEHYEHMAGDPAARRAEHDATLAEFQLTRDDEVLFGYDLLIKLEPRNE